MDDLRDITHSRGRPVTVYCSAATLAVVRRMFPYLVDSSKVRGHEQSVVTLRLSTTVHTSRIQRAPPCPVAGLSLWMHAHGATGDREWVRTEPSV